ncbi:enoyl-CoA hydratase [Pseudolabrys sp. Root1462]|nr:enoyl-CoA hydratase [Pseudolabrys sp. Root1462]KQY99457.1 enoyl-CoA hydratase [Pseudolabrys sp. Root1462]
MSDKILSRKDGAVGHLIFNNPERHNAVSLDMWGAAEAVVADFKSDPAIRVMVVSGAGGKAFVSGADISRFEKDRSTEATVKSYAVRVERAYAAFYDFPKPSLAMIRGYCIGGGMAMAMCCDMRICTNTSKFGIPAAKLGLGYGFKGIKRLVDVVGPSFAKEIFYTARQFTAAEAAAIGLVNRVVPDSDLESYVAGYATAMASNAPLTVDSVKFIVGEVVKSSNERDLAACEAMVQACFASEDYKEGRKAFMEERPPNFTGA